MVCCIFLNKINCAKVVQKDEEIFFLKYHLVKTHSAFFHILRLEPFQQYFTNHSKPCQSKPHSLIIIIFQIKTLLITPNITIVRQQIYCIALTLQLMHEMNNKVLNQDYKRQMANKIQVMGENLFYNKKGSPLDKTQQSQTDKKALRNLQLIFQMNLNRFMRRNKDAFGGELDVPLNRPILTKEEYEASKKVLDNIEDYMDRLVKGMINRNNYLEKELKSFDEGYRESGVILGLDNVQKSNKKQNEPQSPTLLVCENSWQGYQSKPNISRYRSTSYSRPFSATVSIQRNFKKQSPIKLTSRPLSSQLARQTRQRNTINIKSINLHNTKIQKDSKKVLLFRQNLGVIEDYEKYVEQQVYIRKKIMPQTQCDSRILRTGSVLYSKRGEKPSLIQRLRHAAFGTEVLLGEREKVKLHNKIMMVNTVLAFNLNQTQGYKPKSKCWSNRFI